MAYSVEFLYRIIDKYTKQAFSMASATKYFNASLARGKQDVMKLQSRLNSFKTIGFAAALGGAVYLVKKSTQLFDIQTESIANVQAGLESTGGTAGRTLEQLTNQASNLQKNTFFGDETILKNVTAQMLTFTNITENQFDRAQKAVLDVTAKLNGLNASGESTRAVSIMLGKALNDPIANLGALSRSGIQFSKSQKEVIKKLVESGQLSKAQTMILAELERQYGGTAEALAKTTAGQKIQIKNQIGDIQELIGGALEPLRREWQKAILNVLPLVTEKVKEFSKYIKQNKDHIINNVKSTIKMFWGLVKIIKPVAPIIFGIIVAFKVYRLAMMAVAAVQMLVSATNPVTLIIVGVGVLIGLIIILRKKWATIVSVMGDVWDKTKGFLVFVNAPLVGLVEIVKSLYENWGFIKTAFTEKGIVAGLFAIGKALVSGLVAPLQIILEVAAKIPKVGKWAQTAANQIKKFREGLFVEEQQAQMEKSYKDMSDNMHKTTKKTKEELKKPIDTTALTKASSERIGTILAMKEAQYKAREKMAFTEKYVRTPTTVNLPERENTVNANMNLRVYNETGAKIVPMKKSSNLGYNEVGM